MHTFTLDGHSSSEFSLLASGKETYGAPIRDVTTVQIPGRSGDIVIDNGRYSNAEIAYSCCIMHDAKTLLPAARDFYMAHSDAYYRLIDDYRPDEYRLARVSDAFSPTVTLDTAIFELRFDAQPQRYLISGDTPVTIAAGETAVLTNPTHQIALPRITVSASGSVTVGTITLTIGAAMTIDCDAQDAYSGSANMNSSLTLSDGEFPTLAAGNTTVTNGTTANITITPRWWRL